MVGQPISKEARQSRSLKHLILYGLKMMVRRDIGGSDDIGNHPDIIGNSLVGKTAAEAGEEIARMLLKQKDGIKARQSRTIEEIERRAEVVETEYLKAINLFNKNDYKQAAQLMLNACRQLLGGSPTKKTVTPDTHVLK